MPISLISFCCKASKNGGFAGLWAPGHLWMMWKDRLSAGQAGVQKRQVRPHNKAWWPALVTHHRTPEKRYTHDSGGHCLAKALMGPTPGLIRSHFPSLAFHMQMRSLELLSVCTCNYWSPSRAFSLVLSFESAHLVEVFSGSVQATILLWWHVPGFVIICFGVCLPFPKNSLAKLLYSSWWSKCLALGTREQQGFTQ